MTSDYCKDAVPVNILEYKLPYITSGKYSEAQVTARKHPVSIALSNRVLEKIDKEASKQKRSRSEYVELHFENIFFDKQELQT
jgi:hypothetical protein